MEFSMAFRCVLFALCIFFLLYKLVDRRKNHACYIIDYECHKPSDERKLTTDSCANILERNPNLGLEEYKHMLKFIVSSGVGEEAYGPRNILAGREHCPSLLDGISEMEEFFYETLDKLFSKSRISPSEIDILVVNVSTFSPTPSLAARVVNHYKLREDIKVFNLSGMACSGSLISINLVRNIFKSHNNALAVVLSTESIAMNWYSGNDKSMMLTNCICRSGGAAILLTNDAKFKHRAMFKLGCIIRCNLGANDVSYQSVMHKEDDEGRLGIHVGNYYKAVSQALTMNLRLLASKVIPAREILRYFLVSCIRGKAAVNFKTGFDHLCLQPGPAAFIDGVGKNLGLNNYDVEPSRMTVHRFGNTGSSGIWYVLAYMEAKKRLKKGDRILMISHGAGTECSSCTWQVIRNREDEGVWKDCIASYPPKTITNPFIDKFGWLSEENLSTFKSLNKC